MVELNVRAIGLETIPMPTFLMRFRHNPRSGAAFKNSNLFPDTPKNDRYVPRDRHRKLSVFRHAGPRARFSYVLAERGLGCESGSNTLKSAAEVERFTKPSIGDKMTDV